MGLGVLGDPPRVDRLLGQDRPFLLPRQGSPLQPRWEMPGQEQGPSLPALPRAKAAPANGAQNAETKKTSFYSYTHQPCDLTRLRWRSQAVPS